MYISRLSVVYFINSSSLAAVVGQAAGERVGEALGAQGAPQPGEGRVDVGGPPEPDERSELEPRLGVGHRQYRLPAAGPADDGVQLPAAREGVVRDPVQVVAERPPEDPFRAEPLAVLRAFPAFGRAVLPLEADVADELVALRREGPFVDVAADRPLANSSGSTS